ncbi:MAG: GNAT family N-acetyltransferase [Ignavibacteriales bacterium]|nr:GNAT family N-acetyltransferase [Ignavibacteriales bacterium]
MPDGKVAGFVKVALRDWAEGCTTNPLGYIEGWYVEPEYRRQDVAASSLRPPNNGRDSATAKKWHRTLEWTMS